MRPIEKVSQETVLDHWRQVEELDSLEPRNDIVKRLPTDLTWYRCKLQPRDVKQLYMISSRNWLTLTNGTFRVTDAVDNIQNNKSHENSEHLVKDIRKKIQFIKSGGQLDRGLITITDSPSLSGPFSIIEGNRRSVAFACRRMLVGSIIFVGTSPEIVECRWARGSYLDFLKNR